MSMSSTSTPPITSRSCARSRRDRLRPVAGDAALGEAVSRHAPLTVYGARHDARQVAQAVLTMRQRIERELATLELLDDGDRFLRGIEHRLRVVHDQPIHRIPDAHEELARLARRCGFPDGGSLLERVARRQHDIRAAYLQLLGA